MSMTRARIPFLLLLIGCSALLADQFLVTHEERSVYLDKKAWIERQSTLGRSKWRTQRPGHRWSATRSGASWYVAHLENGRWFQLGDHDNGVLQHGDSVRVEVAPLTGRVLRFQRLAKGINRERTTNDAYEDLVPFPVLLAGLCIWLLLVRPGTDTEVYLRGTIVVVGLVFLIALFAMSWPLFRALGWA
jgi:hypothetical protein